MTTNITRRTFLKQGSLVIGAAALSDQWILFNASPAKAQAAGSFRPHAFIEITEDEAVTVWVGQTNLGQGTHTGIAMIIAEELDADWQNVQSKMALAAEPFKDPFMHAQFTGGSTSIRNRWDILRKAGAAARLMLIEAAAIEWDISAGKCTTEPGKVRHPDGKSISYGRLVAKAKNLSVPEDPPLKKAEEYKIIGSKRNRLDIPDKVAGRTIFGMDMQLPGMCIAVIARPPSYGARPSFFNTKAAMEVKGVKKVVAMDDKVAVCAETTYAALRGREKLVIQWTTGSHPDLNDETLDKIFKEHLGKPGVIAVNKGDAGKALETAAKTVEASYKFPYVAHAALEPINCTAWVEKDRCRVWVPTQGQTTAQQKAAAITGLPVDKVEIMTTFAGGGFGLRGEPDPVIDAVTLSQQMKGPVKVMWTREDDFSNDYYRPGSMSTIKGGLDSQGKLMAWSHKVVSPSIMSRSMPEQVKNGIDPSSIHGLPDMVYPLLNHQVEYVKMDLPIPVGFWRSVGYSMNTFVIETVIDELALAAGKDPVEFRLANMETDSRPYRTLQLLAEKSGWGGAFGAGRFRGIAIGSCFGSSAGHMAEISVDRKTGIIDVHKIVCAIDCGPAVYPDAIAAQMEGAVVMALSLAFHERIHFANGGVKTANFDEYKVLTMGEVPEIEVHISKSRHPVGGVGEPGIPTVAPAVANAVFQATGVRLRELPFNRDALRKA